jgi:hypothetical protein
MRMACGTGGKLYRPIVECPRGLRHHGGSAKPKPARQHNRQLTGSFTAPSRRPQMPRLLSTLSWLTTERSAGPVPLLTCCPRLADYTPARWRGGTMGAERSRHSSERRSRPPLGGRDLHQVEPGAQPKLWTDHKR